MERQRDTFPCGATIFAVAPHAPPSQSYALLDALVLVYRLVMGVWATASGDATLYDLYVVCVCVTWGVNASAICVSVD